MPVGIDYRWDEVKVFLAVVRERSLAGAAARLGMDASTVSRRLTAFEDSLGVRLFDRTRDGLYPNAAAEPLVAAAEDIEAAAERLSRAVEAKESAVSGLVRVTAPPGLADDFVIPALAPLRARHPALQIEVDVSLPLADLTRREADLALRTLRPTSGDLVVTRALEVPYAVLASPALAAEIGTLADPAQVAWISYSRELAHVPPARWIARHAPGIEPFLRTSTLPAQISAVAAGLGVAVLPRVYSTLRGFAVVPLGGALAGAAASLPEETAWLVGHRALRDVPRIAAVWSALVDLGRAARGD